MNPFTAIMMSDDVLRKNASCISVGRRMTSCFNSHFSYTPNLSKVFETNTSGHQNFCETLFLEETFTNGTNALAEKGLKMTSAQQLPKNAANDKMPYSVHFKRRSLHKLPPKVNCFFGFFIFYFSVLSITHGPLKDLFFQIHNVLLMIGPFSVRYIHSPLQSTMEVKMKVLSALPSQG